MGQGFSTSVQQSSDGCGNQGASLASQDRASTPQRAFSVFSLFLWLCCISQEQNLWKLILTPSSWSIWESLPRPSCHCARALWGVYLSTCFLIYSRAIVAASVKVQWSQPSNEEAANAAQCCLTWFPKREIICARVACCLMGISVWLFKEHTGLGNSAKARGECKAWLFEQNTCSAENTLFVPVTFSGYRLFCYPTDKQYRKYKEGGFDFRIMIVSWEG